MGIHRIFESFIKKNGKMLYKDKKLVGEYAVYQYGDYFISIDLYAPTDEAKIISVHKRSGVSLEPVYTSRQQIKGIHDITGKETSNKLTKNKILKDLLKEFTGQSEEPKK